jgi:DNA polymerase III subunit delta
MRLTLETLAQQLAQQKIATCYVIASAESFLLQQTRDAIWHAAKKQGAAERQIWEVTPTVNWEAVKWKNSCADLFHRVFVELRCTESLSIERGNQLQALVQALSTMSVVNPTIVVSFDPWKTTVQQNVWFQALLKISEFIMIERLTGRSLAQWINRQLQQVGLRLTDEALSEFIHCLEGDIASAWQTIQKLALIYGPHKIALNRAQLSVALDDQAKFELFDLTDAVLKGQSSRCLRIVQYLEATNTPPALVLGYLLKVLRIIAGLRHGLDHQRSLSALFKQYDVWTKQQFGFKQAVQRLKAEDIPLLFQLAHYTDQCIKGAHTESGWSSLKTLSLYLAGHQIPSTLLPSQY